MPLVTLGPSEGIESRRGETVIVIPVHGADDQFVQCLRAVFTHSPASVPILVMDDASPDDRSGQTLAELERRGVLRHVVHYHRGAENVGFVYTVNDAFARCAPADVIVLNSDCVVTAGWFEAMRAAAADPLVATVSVFTNHGTILSLPSRNNPQPALPQTLDPDLAAEAIAAGSLRLRPRIPTAVGHCFLVKRSALELVGPFDRAFSPGYGEEVDFSQRCVQAGLVHVLADDAFVVHSGSASFSENGRALRDGHERMINTRYRYYDKWTSEVANSTTSTFARSIGAATRALGKLGVTIDARCLTPIVTGTQIQTLELIAALSEHDDLNLRVIVPPDLGGYARSVLVTLPVDVIGAHAIGEATRTDISHRPFQVSSTDDLGFLGSLGHHVIITHLDLISHHNPSYYETFDAWSRFRQVTRFALAYADRTVFISHSSAEQAIREELVPAELADVVYLGTDHRVDELTATPKRPPAIERLAGRPFLLCLGTDYRHKNRVFALRVLDAMRRRHDWEGALVFAGAHVPVGSSAAEEARFRLAHADLDDAVIDLAAVDEAAKRWLLSAAAAMIYPTVEEGFGLVPFEAAEAGLLCAFAWHSSIAELLPSELALLVQWDADATADRLIAMIGDEPRRAAHIAAVRAASARFTWRRTAIGLRETYERAMRSAQREARRIVLEIETVNRRHQALQAEHEELVRGYHQLRREYSVDAAGLVGPSGVIPKDLQRPLLALGSRRAISTPVWGLLRLGYRIGHLARGASAGKRS